MTKPHCPHIERAPNACDGSTGICDGCEADCPKDRSPYKGYTEKMGDQLELWAKDTARSRAQFRACNEFAGIFLIRAPWYKRLWWWLCGIDTTERIKIKTSLTREH